MIASLLLTPVNGVPVLSYEVENGGNIETRQYEDWNGNQAYDVGEHSWVYSTLDYDSDGLVNEREILWGTDPLKRDTDEDGLTDGQEVDLLKGPSNGFNPLLWDTDSDGYSDFDECYYCYSVNYLAGGGYSYYDYDDDGMPNPVDSDPFNPQVSTHSNNPELFWRDENGNGINDNSEGHNYDYDGDGWGNDWDTHPEDYYLYKDWDWDGTNDEYLSDMDGDGVPDYNDPRPQDATPWRDWNYDGFNDTENPDCDGDGYRNDVESDPSNNLLWDDWNRDGRSDSLHDSDGDGRVDSVDTHDNDPTLWSDRNNDGYNDEQQDSDGDGFVDSVDTHDYNPALWSDRNNDGYNDDQDFDGDGVINSNDSHITNPALWSDRNNDGYNDDQDFDGDGVINSNDSHITNPALWSDGDNDGLNTQHEWQLGTNPSKSDSDTDGLLDGEEVAHGTNPNKKDSDDDGLTDHEELIVYSELVVNGKRLDPNDANSVNDTYVDFWMVSSQDTDNDGIPDLIEQSYLGKMNPNNPLDGQGDLDADGFTNLEEYQNGFRFDGNLQIHDMDRDGITDTEEEYWSSIQPGIMFKFWFDDSVQDPDNDGVLNFEEVRYKLDPTNATTHVGITDLEWININCGKNWQMPLLPGDADGDGLPDLWEHRYFLDIRDPATPAENPDGDSLSNLQEYQSSRHPLIRDFGGAVSPPTETPDPLGSSTNQVYDQAYLSSPGNWSVSRSFNVVEAGIAGGDDSLTPRIQTYKIETVDDFPDTEGSTGWITHSDLSHDIYVKADGPQSNACEPTSDIGSHSSGDTCACQHGTENRFRAYVIEPSLESYTFIGLTLSEWNIKWLNGDITYEDIESIRSHHPNVPPWDFHPGHGGFREWETNGPCSVGDNEQKNSWAYMRLVLPQNLPDNAERISVDVEVEKKSEDGAYTRYNYTMEIRPGERYSLFHAGGEAPINGHIKITYKSSGGPPAAPVPQSIADAAGTRYRKFGLNGAPIPDSKPQVQEENGENPEETHIDPFLCQLRHSTSDVYVEAPGLLIPLAVRRSLTSDVWNNRSGLRPEERPYEPFGPGWTSNICSYVCFEDGNKAEVHDEDGSVSTYYRLNTSGGMGGQWYHDRQEHRDVKTRLNSFNATLTSPVNYSGNAANLANFGNIQLNKKFGTKCYYEMVYSTYLHQVLRQDRKDINQPVKSFTYARLSRVEDRAGNQLIYQYDLPGSLIPSKIYDPKRDGHQIWIQQHNGRVVKVRDPNGNDIDYSYQPLNGSSSSITVNGDSPIPYTGYQRSPATVLTKVSKGNGTSEVGYAYRMQLDKEQGTSGTTYHTHLELTALENENHQVYTFGHQLNRSMHSWDGTSTRLSYGLPMRLSTVALPQGLGQLTLETNRSIVPNGGNFAAAAADFYTIIGRQGNPSQSYRYIFRDAEFLEPTGDPQATTSPHAVTYAFKKMDIVAPSANIGDADESKRKETYEFSPINSMALSAVTDRNGRRTEFVYGTGGYDDPIKEINPTSTVSQGKLEKTFDYSAQRLLQTMVDADGVTTNYTFNNLGLRISETVAGPVGVTGGYYKTTEYDTSYYWPPGMVKQEKLDALAVMRGAPLNLSTTIFPPILTTYSTNRYTSVSSSQSLNGQAAVTKTVTDFSGNKRSVTDARGMTTTFDYDSQNRLTQVNYPDGTFKILIYDPCGNLIRERNEEGVFSFYTYDALNRRTSSTIDLNRNGLPNSRYTTVTYDGNGQVVYNGDIVTEVLEYNSLNQAVLEVDARGIHTRRTYDVLGRLLTVSVNHGSGNAQTTSYTYQGSIATNGVAEAGGSVFDVSGYKPVSMTDAMGNVTTYTYDDLYRCIKTTRPDGNVLHTTYDRKGRVTSQSSAALPTWSPGTTGYDTAPTNAEALKFYSKRLKQKSATDTVFITQFFYDALGQVTKTVLPDLNGAWPNLKTEETLYTPHGEVWKQTDKAGVVKRFEYNTAGLLYRSHLDNPSATTATTSIIYDLAGNAVQHSDALSRTTLTHYDKRNRVVKVVSPKVLHYGSGTAESEVSETTYDAMGRVAVVTNPLGYSSRNLYDAAGRVIYKEDAKGNLTRFSYDAGGNVLTVRDARGNITTNSYDHFNQLILTTDAENQQTKFAYDWSGRKILQIDGRAPVGWNADMAYAWVNNYTALSPGVYNMPATSPYSAAFFYDSLGRSVAQNFANTDIVSSTYVLDRKTKDTNARGKATTYTYDMAGRITKKSAPHLATGTSTITSTLTYNLNKGYLTKVVDLTPPASSSYQAETVEYQYDAIGRIIGEESYGRQHTYEYDLVGNRLRSLLASYGATPRIVTTTYDALNRPKTIIDDVQTSSNADDRHTTYEYDRAGRAVKMVSANNQVTLNEYDENGRLIHRWLYQHVTNLTSSGQLAEFNWSYDEVGNVVSQAETWNASGTTPAYTRTTVMTYDNVSRLKTETATDSRYATATTHYQYDGASNRISKEVVVGSAGAIPPGVESGYWAYTYNASNQLTQTRKWADINSTSGTPQEGSTYTYDADGNRTSRVMDGTATLLSRTTKYIWDSWNRLDNVDIPQGLNLTGRKVYQYEYDYRMRRRSVLQSGGGLPTLRTAIVFSGGLSVAEFVRAANSDLTNTSIPAVEYMRGPDMGGGVGGLLGTSRNPPNGNLYKLPTVNEPKKVRYNLSNGRGDIVAQSDGGGILTWSASYEAYGKRPAEAGTNADKQRANSKDEDPTGLLNEGFRYRDIETGVWLSRDPAGFVDGPNLYAYVKQNPWTGWDPDGLATVSELQDKIADVRKAQANARPSKVEGKKLGGGYEQQIRKLEARIAKIEATAKNVNQYFDAIDAVRDIRGDEGRIPFRINAAALDDTDAAHKVFFDTSNAWSGFKINGALTLGPSALMAAAKTPGVLMSRAGIPATSGRGISKHGGIFSSTTNEAGGEIWTSVGRISQNDVAPLVNGGLYKGGGQVDILSGAHGLPSGGFTVDGSMFMDDIARFGNIPGVSVHNFPQLAPQQINNLLKSPNTTIGGFCDSEAVLSPFLK
ncbi:RHS repeat-associated core domain-containing protein [Prosthecobacter fusiformis]|uniref:RHS repeat-associated core domain-containing protein n=1 Tax=Prosthecobacter fusiformis TaxID=48464 RepID=UPI00141505A7|nr:RHS repeat-associated core domain-containing protein [Prosthecobacter fusiformis]